MTDEEVKKIDVESENDLVKLKEIILYWQEKAFVAQYQLLLIRGNLSNEQIKNSFNIEKIKEIMNT